MRSLAECPVAALRSLRGLLADIDDTITTDGRLEADAYAAMQALHQAGVRLIPVTGRPAGWCDHIARMWPVDAVVGENGAFWFRYDPSSRSMRRRYVKDEASRREDALRLREIADEILALVPAAGVSADQPYREADLAIDFCEDVPRLPATEVDRIATIMQARGMSVKVSSIHVNGWFGRYDKLTMARSLLEEEFGAAPASVVDDYGYVGDSPNDEPMFAFFRWSFGVANVAQFAPRMQHLPQFITAAASGRGFVELAQSILRSRGLP